jgi:hypothetical protein
MDNRISKDGPVPLPARAFGYEFLKPSLDAAIAGPDEGRSDRVASAIKYALDGLIYQGEDIMSSFLAASPGYFPNWSIPAAFGVCDIGHNDLYQVPVGRKAVLFDLIFTNVTGATIGVAPEAYIGGAYRQLGPVEAESPAVYGHNYGSTGVKFAPLVLHEGEKVSALCDVAGLTVWAVVVEMDMSSPLERAMITQMAVGDNVLLTVPAASSISIGIMGFSSTNLPVPAQSGIHFYNGSGSDLTMGGYFIVPPAGAAGPGNAYTQSRTITANTLFDKSFSGGIAPGGKIVIKSDSAAAGVLAWTTYVLGQQ